MTFYSCYDGDQTVVLNGKEFYKYKLKFEKVNKMSPSCEIID